MPVMMWHLCHNDRIKHFKNPPCLCRRKVRDEEAVEFVNRLNDKSVLSRDVVLVLSHSCKLSTFT